jgi:glycerol-3-phosphate dehydrogenase subunit B
MSGRGRHYDAIVVGAGLSGLIAAYRLAAAGLRVGVIAKGGGYLHFISGCVDVLGRDAHGKPVRDPLAAVEELIGRVPKGSGHPAESPGRAREDVAPTRAIGAGHPYTLAGVESLVEGMRLFRSAMTAEGLPFVGDLRSALTLPTAIGSTRVTCLAPAGMAFGDMAGADPMLIVGFRQFRDFYPPYLAANLQRCAAFPVRYLYLDMPHSDRSHPRHLLSLDIARALDDASTRQLVGTLVKANLGNAGRVGFPAVLGLDAHREAVAHLQDIIRRPVFEIPTLPPSVPGIRVNNALRRQLARQRGVRVEVGFWVRGRIEGRRAVEIDVESAGRPTTYNAEIFVLATGGIGGGGILAGRDGTLCETVFGLAVAWSRPAGVESESRAGWALPRFLGPESQPINLAGVRTSERLQAIAPSGEVVENVFVVGSNLPGWDPVREGSGEGVALATAWKATSEALEI